MIESDFDVSFVSAMALREKQIQQNYRPVIAVHKWFARRPGTLFRSLLLSEFVPDPLGDAYFKPHRLQGIHVADPFMGGGTPLLEANRLGCDITGYDINPMAYWIVRQEIEHLDLAAYGEATEKLIDWLKSKIGRLYQTRCQYCDKVAHVKYFLWVKTVECRACHKDIDLFSGYLLAENRRHPKNVFVCSTCGHLNETEDRKSLGHCVACEVALSSQGTAKHGTCRCPHCDTVNTYPRPDAGPPNHRMFAIEYHCSACKIRHAGRFFKKPDADDLQKYGEAEQTWAGLTPLYVPDDEIPKGDETNRLHRWGYRYYRDMFNKRQLLGLELSCRAIRKHPDERVRHALATNLSDLLRYQNMLCRYDTMALKSLDIFSVHGFPVGLIQCESNLLGIANKSQGTNVGSGGWTNIVEKYARAKSYCDEPFEVQQQGGRKIQIPVPGEWIGDRRNGAHPPGQRNVSLRCESATGVDLLPHSLDAVVTDPPYFGNVQYAELMDFCYVWLRRLVGGETAAFGPASTRNPNELTGNATMDRGLNHFSEGMSNVFIRMAEALKPGAPLTFTYHHNKLDAYYPIAVAILDAGLTCTASIPCPAEMGASIHINGTGSSIVDTVFVCRATGKMRRHWIVDTPEGVARLVQDDVAQLRYGSVTPTRGDIRCIIFGHLIRLAIWTLRRSWARTTCIEERLATIADQIQNLGGLSAVEACLGDDLWHAPSLQRWAVRESSQTYGSDDDYVSF